MEVKRGSRKRHPNDQHLPPGIYCTNPVEADAGREKPRYVVKVKGEYVGTYYNLEKAMVAKSKRLEFWTNLGF